MRMLVEGPMETVSKAALCALVLAAAIKVMADLGCGESARHRAERASRDSKLRGINGDPVNLSKVEEQLKRPPAGGELISVEVKVRL